METAKLRDTLARAEVLCRRMGERWTPLRERALTAMLRADKPVKAYDLLPQLSDDQTPAKPATAYRALEFLEQLGLVHRIEAMNAYVVCAHGGGEHPTALYICERCGSSQEHILHHSVTGEDVPEGFKTRRIVTEIYGLCGDCARAA